MSEETDVLILKFSKHFPKFVLSEILLLYVNDGLIFSKNKDDLKLLTDLKKSFQISDSEAKFYLGLEIEQEMVSNFPKVPSRKFHREERSHT